MRVFCIFLLFLGQSKVSCHDLPWHAMAYFSLGLGSGENGIWRARTPSA